MVYRTRELIDDITSNSPLKEAFDCIAENEESKHFDLGLEQYGSPWVFEDGSELFVVTVGYRMAFSATLETMGQDNIARFTFGLLFEPDSLIWKLDLPGEEINAVLRDLIGERDGHELYVKDWKRIRQGHYAFSSFLRFTDIPNVYVEDEFKKSCEDFKTRLSEYIWQIAAADKSFTDDAITESLIKNAAGQDDWRHRFARRLFSKLNLQLNLVK